MEIGESFNNLSYYNSNMANAIEDKLWFMKHLPYDDCLFVDFGCADETVLNFMTKIPKLWPNCTYVGYDISETMINLAKEKYDWDPKQKVIFTDKWDIVKEEIHNCKNCKKVLILSSVIHEVYSYGQPEDIKEFWDRILYSDFDYIFIRDMMLANDALRESDLDMVSKIIAKTDSDQLESFESNWGRLENNMQNVIHFLLKYRWKINWDREVKENYFPIMLDEFLEWFNIDYKINYLERFQIPYLHDCILKDYNINMEDRTHIKIFLEKNKE